MLNVVLRCFRIVKNVSITQMAKEIGISGAYISDIELGNKTPTINMLKKFANFFDVPTSKVLEIQEMAEKNNLSFQEVLFMCVKYEIEEKTQLHGV